MEGTAGEAGMREIVSVSANLLKRFQNLSFVFAILKPWRLVRNPEIEIVVVSEEKGTKVQKLFPKELSYENDFSEKFVKDSKNF